MWSMKLTWSVCLPIGELLRSAEERLVGFSQEGGGRLAEDQAVRGEQQLGFWVSACHHLHSFCSASVSILSPLAGAQF